MHLKIRNFRPALPLRFSKPIKTSMNEDMNHLFFVMPCQYQVGDRVSPQWMFSTCFCKFSCLLSACYIIID